MRETTGPSGTPSCSPAMAVSSCLVLLGPASGARQAREVTQLVCVTITDLPGHRDRARAGGAAVSEIGARANRARSYTVDDPEGHRWYFSEPL